MIIRQARLPCTEQAFAQGFTVAVALAKTSATAQLRHHQFNEIARGFKGQVLTQIDPVDAVLIQPLFDLVGDYGRGSGNEKTLPVKTRKLGQYGAYRPLGFVALQTLPALDLKPDQIADQGIAGVGRQINRRLGMGQGRFNAHQLAIAVEFAADLFVGTANDHPGHDDEFQPRRVTLMGDRLAAHGLDIGAYRRRVDTAGEHHFSVTPGKFDTRR